MIQADYIIVGAGLTGAVIARSLADAGREVLVIDRRSHLGGNVHDTVHPSGIRYHTYGPHYFRTSSDLIWEWVNRFDTFDHYEARVLSAVDGSLVPWPVSAEYIARSVGADWAPSFHGTATNLEEAALSLMPRPIYEQFVKPYNEKQWGVPAHSLSPDLCKRFDVRSDEDCRLTPNAKHQGIPSSGYAEWTRRMFDGIPVLLNCDYLEDRERFHARRTLVYTGPIDEFFGFDLGRLAYRGQVRTTVYHSDANRIQPVGQVNNPQHSGGPHIRTLEWKHMLPEHYADRISGTLITTETPCSPSDPSQYEYPFPNAMNARLYSRYRERANAIPDLIIAGRLGNYRYYDMDQAIASAMAIARRITTTTHKPKWTGQQSSQKPESQSHRAENRPQLAQPSQYGFATRKREGQSEPKAQTQGPLHKSQESSFKSANETLVSDILAILRDHVSRHYCGTRMDPQTFYSLTTSIKARLSSSSATNR